MLPAYPAIHSARQKPQLLVMTIEDGLCTGCHDMNGQPGASGIFSLHLPDRPRVGRFPVQAITYANPLNMSHLAQKTASPCYPRLKEQNSPAEAPQFPEKAC